MSTRARIGILLPDDSILSVYHHFDGYPEGLGVTLKEHYNTYEKVAELIDGGNMSNCWSDSKFDVCLLYTSPSPRDKRQSRMPSSA